MCKRSKQRQLGCRLGVVYHSNIIGGFLWVTRATQHLQVINIVVFWNSVRYYVIAIKINPRSTTSNTSVFISNQTKLPNLNKLSFFPPFLSWVKLIPRNLAVHRILSTHFRNWYFLSCFQWGGWIFISQVRIVSFVVSFFSNCLMCFQGFINTSQLFSLILARSITVLVCRPKQLSI